MTEDDSVPTSNIDDVQVTLNETDHTDNHHSMDNQHNEITVSHDKIEEPAKPSPVKPAIKHRGSHDSINSSKGSAAKPSPNESKHRHNGPASVPVPSLQPEPVQSGKKPAENSHINGHTADKHTDSNTSLDEERNHDHRNKRPSLTPSVTYSGSAPPTGTLADLKKQRAQHQMRNFRNSISEDSTLGNSVYPPNERNGHSPGLTDSRSNSLTYLPEDRPKHRFTATNTEIIGGDENKTNCCIIL